MNYQMPRSVAIIVLFLLFIALFYGVYLDFSQLSQRQYKEVPCYYYKDFGKGQLVGINESDYSRIKILEGNDRLIVLDTRDENHPVEIPLCEEL